MLILRFLLLLFNAVVIGFLIYKMVTIANQAVSKTQKSVVIIGGIMLLLAPLGMFFRFFPPTPQYFIIYPLAIVLFLYFTKQLA